MVYPGRPRLAPKSDDVCASNVTSEAYWFGSISEVTARLQGMLSATTHVSPANVITMPYFVLSVVAVAVQDEYPETSDIVGVADATKIGALAFRVIVLPPLRPPLLDVVKATVSAYGVAPLSALFTPAANEATACPDVYAAPPTSSPVSSDVSKSN